MARRNDEFNKGDASNSRRGSNFEFGSIPRVEYNFKDENPIAVKNEVNGEKKVRDENNDHKKKADDELLKEALKSEATTVSEPTAVTGAEAATSAASTASAVVASVSAVAVTTVSVIVGINLYLSAKCRFEYLSVDDYCVRYALELTDTRDEKYEICLESKAAEYFDSRELEEGMNEGEFYDLEVAGYYNLTVRSATMISVSIFNETIYVGDYPEESTYESPFDSVEESFFEESSEYTVEASSESLYEESSESFFEESSEPLFEESSESSIEESSEEIDESYVEGVLFHSPVNVEDNTTSVRLAYFDQTGRYSDFVLILTGDDGVSRAFPLEATEQPQTISGGDYVTENPDEVLFLGSESPFTYALQYNDNGETKVIEEEEPFYFDFASGFFVDPGIDSASNSIHVSCYVQDKKGFFEEFYLHVEDENGNGRNYTLNRDADGHIDSSISGNPEKEGDATLEFAGGNAFTFTFSYSYLGEVYEEAPLNITLNDDAYQGAVHGAFFEGSADPMYNTVSLMLSYDDPDNHFTDFEIEMTDAFGLTRTYPLAKTTDYQEIGSEFTDSGDDPSGSSNFLPFASKTDFKYVVKYLDNGVPCTVAGENAIAFDYVAPISFNVYPSAGPAIEYSLEYNNQSDRYSDFMLHLENGQGAEIDIELQESTSGSISDMLVSEADVFEFDVGTFVNYSLSYNDKGVKVTPYEGSIEISDTQSTSESVFYSVNFEGTVDPAENSAALSMDFVDNEGHFSNFELMLTNESGESKLFELVGDTQQQWIEGGVDDGVTDPSTIFRLDTGEAFTYVLRYENEGVVQVVSGPAPIYFDFIRDVSISPKANSEANAISVSYELADHSGRYTQVILYVTDSHGNSRDYGLPVTEGLVEVELSGNAVNPGEVDLDFSAGQTIYYQLTYQEWDNPTSYEEGSILLTD